MNDTMSKNGRGCSTRRETGCSLNVSMGPCSISCGNGAACANSPYLEGEKSSGRESDKNVIRRIANGFWRESPRRNCRDIQQDCHAGVTGVPGRLLNPRFTSRLRVAMILAIICTVIRFPGSRQRGISSFFHFFFPPSLDFLGSLVLLLASKAGSLTRRAAPDWTKHPPRGILHPVRVFSLLSMR